jgi:hypothetical protein
MSEESTTPHLVERWRCSSHGHGVTLAVVVQKGRPAGSSGDVRLRHAAVAAWADGMIVPVTNHGDIDDARAAAAHLPESRG